MGLKLLERTSHGVIPTPSGAFIYEESKTLIAESRRILDRAHELQGDTIKRVRFGVSTMRSAGQIVTLWQTIRHEHPDIEVEMVSIPDDIRIWPKVFGSLGDQIDVTVSAKPSPHQDWFEKCSFKDIYHTPYLCMIALDNPLARRERITFEDLEDQTVFMAYAGYAPQVDEMRAFIETHYPSVRIENFEPYDFDSANKVLRDKSIAFVIADWKDIHPGFKFIPLADDFSVTMSLLYARECTDAVREFVDAIAEAAKKTDD